MTHNIDFAAAFKVSKPDSRIKIPGFQFERENNKSSFRDSLREALKSGRQDMREANEAASAGKRIANRPETQPNNLKKTESEANEASEKQGEKIVKKAEKVLLLLEELAKLQQIAEMPEGMNAKLPENIKEALTELSEDLGKSIAVEAASIKAATEEIRALLEGMLEQHRNSGSLMKLENEVDGDANASNIIRELQTIETTEISGDKNNVKTEAETAEPALMPEGNESMKAEIRATNEESANEKQEIKTAAPEVNNRQENKETQTSTEEIPDDVKNALDGNVEKVDATGREQKLQDEEAGSIKEAVKDIRKTAAAVPDKKENPETPVINQDQPAVNNKAEKIYNQTAAKPAPVSKTEIIQQIVKKAEVVLTDTHSEMRMQLEPENLGKLTLKLAVEKGIVTAKFIAESHQVKQIIESSFNELRDMLQEKGLAVQNFSVSVGQENKEFGSSSFQQWNDKVKLSARSLNRGGYQGYPETEGALAIAANPYSLHYGKFDQRA